MPILIRTMNKAKDWSLFVEDARNTDHIIQRLLFFSPRDCCSLLFSDFCSSSLTGCWSFSLVNFCSFSNFCFFFLADFCSFCLADFCSFSLADFCHLYLTDFFSSSWQISAPSPWQTSDLSSWLKILTCALRSTRSKLVVEITQLSLYLCARWPYFVRLWR